MSKIKNYLKEIVSFIVILVIASNLISYYKSSDLNKEKFDFNNVILMNNSKYTYDKNKNFIIYFWGSWCPICKFQSPNIQELKEDFNVLSIANNSGNNQDIKIYLKEHDLSFEVINDIHNNYTQNFNIQAFPTTLVYNKKGELLFSDIGFTSVLSIKLKTWWFE